MKTSQAKKSPELNPKGTLLTVVVAAYNHEEFIANCLNSIPRSAEVPSIELIIIDDGSTDQTAKVISEFVVGFPHPVRVLSKSNSGLTDSLNLGLELAHGDFVAFIAGDDEYNTSEVERIVAAIGHEEFPHNVMLMQAEYFGERSGLVYRNSTELLLNGAREVILYELSTSYPRPMLLQATIFKTDFLRQVDPWRGRPLLDDWSAFLRIAQHNVEKQTDFSWDFSITLCKYRIHGGGAHKNLERQLLACIQICETLVQPVFRDESIANVYIDRGLTFLSAGQYRRGIEVIFRGFRKGQRVRLVRRMARRIFSKFLYRVGASNRHGCF